MKKSFLPGSPVLLVIALAAIFPLHALAAAGVTQFTSGDTTVRRGNAAADTLSKGRTVDTGDTILTGSNGQAQIRFTDGGLVAVQPNSEFNIRNYADRNDPKTDNFLVDLTRGGMRAITGLIGKRNRDNYKVITRTATVGIRGSSFHLAYNPDGSLSVATEQDAIEVCTAAGCVGLTAGESARVGSNSVLPSRTNARASLPIPPLTQDPVVAANQTRPAGTSAVLPPTQGTGAPVPSAGPVPLPVPAIPSIPFTGVITDLHAAFLNGGGALQLLPSETLGRNTTLDPQMGQPLPDAASITNTALTAYASADSATGSIQAVGRTTPLASFPGAQVQDTDFIGWGYWANADRTTSGIAVALTDVHYIVGRPTPVNQMPGTGPAEYALVGGTAPTATNGGSSVTGQLVSGSLSADFTAGQVGVQITTRFGEQSVQFNLPLKAAPNSQPPVLISGSTFASTEGARVSINGFFSGNLANRAGLVYGLDSGNLGRVTGAAGFSQTSSNGLAVLPANLERIPASPLARN